MRKVMHVIAQAHLDPAWLWPWSDGMSEALRTMQSAVDRMGETKDLRFSRSSAITYRWVKESDPVLFKKISTLIRQGRWEAVNGWIEQPDCNIPSTESFIRHCLYGKGFLKDNLKTDVVVGYNVDSFGHSAGLPQILAKAGYKYYVFMRPHAYELDAPPLFWWEGPDGSRVLTFRIWESYCQSPKTTPEEFEEILRRSAASSFPPGFDHTAFFFGVGDHGGGPTKLLLERLHKLRADSSLPELRFSTLSDFFAAVARSPSFRKLPVFKGELRRHAVGCYSACAAIKAANRRAERGLVETETVTTLLGGKATAADQAVFEDAWWTVLFNQFHDIMAGSCVKRCYDEALDELGGVKTMARKRTMGIAQSLARRVDTRSADGGNVLFVLNTLPWRRKALVAFDAFTSPDGGAAITHLQTGDGKQLPIQWRASDACFGPHLMEWKKLTAQVDLPAMGYAVCRIVKGAASKTGRTTVSNVMIDDKTLGVKNLKTSNGGRTLAAPVSLVVIGDDSDTWGHGVKKYDNIIGRPALVSSKIVEDGPLLRTVRQCATWNQSEIILDITCYIAEPSLVELRIRTDWREKGAILKLEVPTALKGTKAFAKVPGAVVERATDGGEDAGQDWMAVSGDLAGKPFTVGVINDSTYSHSCEGGCYRAVVVRAAPYARHDPVKLPEDSDNPYLDHGLIEKKFWIVWGEGSYADLRMPRLAEELQAPPIHVEDSAHPGTEPGEASFLDVSPDAVVVTAVKKPERGSGLVVRLQETHGRSCVAVVRWPGKPAGVKTDLRPFEIKTLLISSNGGFSAREVTLLEEGQ